MKNKAKLSQNRREVYFVLSTHWDREWREAFQEMRYGLVSLLDRVIDGLSEGRMDGPFFTDGQSILIEDYIEIRPEREQEVRRLIREGKLILGPWYTMPDLFLVSGESLIRNLLIGREATRAYGGEPSCAGYVCDMFGHNSQMPQIFIGCQIKAVFLWRGVKPQDIGGKRTFLWRGADGTEIPCHRFGASGYGTYAYAVREGHKVDSVHDQREFSKHLKNYLEFEASNTEIEPILCLDTCDHQIWDEKAYGLMNDFRRSNSDFQISHASLETYAEAMAAQKERIKTVMVGELREPANTPMMIAPNDPACDDQWVIPGVLSSRVWMKQTNRVCETLLCLWAEPLSAFAHSVINAEIPGGFLNIAWRALLTNHAHDSIGGCSIDQVHRDMAYRFDQCRLIADRLTREAASLLSGCIEGEVGDGEVRVTIFNPMPRPYDEIAELALEIPVEWPSFNEFFGFEPKPGFRIYLPDGRELPYQRLGQTMNRVKARIRETKFPETVNFHDVKIALPLQIPALGYTSLTIRHESPSLLKDIPTPGTGVTTMGYSITRHPEVPGMATGTHSMQNEHIAVTIESNGTMVITDRHSGQGYRNLLTFEDRADIGDGWYHGIAANDQTFVSTACRSDVALVYDGPLITRFRIQTLMRVPEEFKFDGMIRSEKLVEMSIDNHVTLRAGQKYVEISSTIGNRASDHRLRVLFPTCAQTQTYLADSQFDVIERPIALRKDNHLYREMEIETKPQQSWTAVFDSKRGLAVVAEGLLETAVRDIADRSIALTLFRSTRRTVFTGGEQGGQLHEAMTFHYRIFPLVGVPDRVMLCEQGQQISAGLRIVQHRRQDLAIYRGSQSLPSSAGFFELSGPAVMTSVRQVGEAIDVRLFNPTSSSVEAKVSFQEMPASTLKFLSAKFVDIEGLRMGKSIPITACSAKVKLKKKQIVTLRFSTDSMDSQCKNMRHAKNPRSEKAKL